MLSTVSLKKYIVVDQMIVAAAINFLINGLISWATFREFKSLSVWNSNPVYLDILLTALLLPLLSCLVNSQLIEGKIKGGSLRLRTSPRIPKIGAHTMSVLMRSIVLGLLTLLSVGVSTLMLLEVVFPKGISMIDYVLFKSLWSSILALFLAYPIAIWSIRRQMEAIINSPA
jgi:hypothetical protein